ncbi:AMP-binding protein [Marinilabiliaceae bacterium ANBcel2]|nr:AMP-binding protein [Marinilabiliaceae bacterium ANBcel2]
MQHLLHYNKITINDIVIEADKVDNREHPDSLKDIIQFLSEWFSTKDYMMVTTSGSTGKPKNIKVKKSEMVESAIRTINFFELKPGMKVLNCLPVSFIAGKMMVIRAIVGSLNLICVEPAANPLNKLNRKVEFAAFTPMQMINILKSKKKHNLLTKVIIGGGKTDSDLNSKLQDVPFDAWESYGMTETLTHVALRKINGNTARNSFLPLSGIKTELNSNGCLIIHYGEKFNKTVITNDIAELYSDGSFIIKGRVDNIINSGGIKISPEDLEEKIKRTTQNNVIITFEEDKVLGQKIVALTNTKPEKPRLFFDKISGALSKYEKPYKLYYIKKVPLTQSGKLKRKEIRCKELELLVSTDLPNE